LELTIVTRIFICSKPRITGINRPTRGANSIGWQRSSYGKFTFSFGIQGIINNRFSAGSPERRSCARRGSDHAQQHEQILDPLVARSTAKFFATYGVKSKVIWVRGNPAQIATLASGDTQIAYGGAPTALAAAIGGRDIKIIASLSSREISISSLARGSRAQRTCAINDSAFKA
jgi:hypothetical protein